MLGCCLVSLHTLRNVLNTSLVHLINLCSIVSGNHDITENSQQELTLPLQHGSESSPSPTHSPSSQVMVDVNVDNSANFINGEDDNDTVKMELPINEELEEISRSPKGGRSFHSSPNHHQSQNQPLFPPMMSDPPPLLGKGYVHVMDLGIFECQLLEWGFKIKPCATLAYTVCNRQASIQLWKLQKHLKNIFDLP